MSSSRLCYPLKFSMRKKRHFIIVMKCPWCTILFSYKPRLLYSLVLRREARAAERAAKPVPNRTTVIGSGIGTGPEGIGVGVSGGNVTTCVGVLGTTEVLVGVLVGPTGVLVGVAVGGVVEVAVGCSVTVVSAAGTWADTMVTAFHPGATRSVTKSAIVINKIDKGMREGLFIATILLDAG